MPAPQKFPCLTLTYRPKGGVTPFEINLIKDFCDKRCKFFTAVTEMVGDDPSTKHVHAILFLKKPTAKADLFGQNKAFHNMMRTSMALSDSLFEVAIRSDGVYNDDFLSKYMTKVGSEVFYDSSSMVDLQDRMEFYVDRQKKEPESKTFEGDPYFLRREKLWYEMHPTRPPANYDEVGRFLACMMYRDRKIMVTRCPRKLKMEVRSLYHFMMRSTELDFHSNIDLHE